MTKLLEAIDTLSIKDCKNLIEFIKKYNEVSKIIKAINSIQKQHSNAI